MTMTSLTVLKFESADGAEKALGEILSIGFKSLYLHNILYE